MNGMLNALADSILAKPLEACNAAELRELAAKYPYAAAIQFLYAQKLKDEGNDQVNGQLQKTLLYYNTPLFINYLLNSNTKKITEVLHIDQKDIAPGSKKYLAENIHEADDYAVAVVIDDGRSEPAVNDPDITDLQDVNETLVEQNDIKEDSIEINNDAGQIESFTETTPIPDVPVELPPLPEFKIEAIDPSTAGLLYTPYHTVDYFAAQGIKLSEEQISNDRFGAQLKSFTQWLKHMKRLPGSIPHAAGNAAGDQAVAQMAEKSLKGENADTEAMAEVWIKQGNLEKAIEIYQKLSLQNPLKSAYFAAKIDHLKN